MKHNVMRAFIASALMISIVSVTLIALSTGGEPPAHQESLEAPSNAINTDNLSGADGPGSGGSVVAGRKPGVGVGSTARRDAEVGAWGLASDDGMVAGSKPGLGAGSGGIIKNTGAVLAGGRGGIGGDCEWDRVA